MHQGRAQTLAGSLALVALGAAGAYAWYRLARVQRRRARLAGPQVDYSMRSGFAKPAAQMRGAAAGTVKQKRSAHRMGAEAPAENQGQTTFSDVRV